MRSLLAVPKFLWNTKVNGPLRRQNPDQTIQESWIALGTASGDTVERSRGSAALNVDSSPART
jgi:hypothetical protein